MDDDKTPPEDLEATETSAPETPSIQRMGNYRLLQKVGEGGMGEVWEAEQEKPLRRRVAIKLIKAGMDTKHVVARFESERQALALMSHPSIAKVFDAGATERGRLYFAMEYVKGEPITVYCDKHGLSTSERLKLFVKVCDGVQHAHQNGIIHRDLKPSNVLVELSDGRPVPKIIDFGVAKATQQRLTEKTMFTQLGTLVGTPAYMSPEQVEMTGLDVDTRTDVYSLGVMLYELLVGALPFDPKELKAASYEEIRRKIREEEPSRPSARITTPVEGSTEAARRRALDLPTLKRELRGDLDWITMKALAKNRTRRYGSPSELAADIGRHLRHEPVEAGPPSAPYRLGKFVRRHRVGVGAGAVVLLALVAGLVGATYGLVRATRAEAQALREATTANQVSEFLVGLFEVTDPSQARGNEVTAREILDQGAEKVSRELQDQPLVRARLLQTMGRVYSSLWLHEPARLLLKDALEIRRAELGDLHPRVAESLMELGDIVYRSSEYDAARAYFQEALEIREEVLDPMDATVAQSLVAVAKTHSITGDVDQLPPLLNRVLEINASVLSPGHTAEASSLRWLPHHPVDFPEALGLLERDLAIREAALGPEHPVVAVSMGALGTYLAKQGEFERAKPLLERALALTEKVYGPDHPETDDQVLNLSLAYMRSGNVDSAIPYAERHLSITEKLYGAESRLTGQALYHLGKLIGQTGDLPRARTLLERSVETMDGTAGHEIVLAQALRTLGSILFQMREMDRGLQVLRRSVVLNEKTYGSDSQAAADSLHALARALLRTGDLEEAVRILERCVTICRVLYGPDHPAVQRRITELADALLLTGDSERARRLYQEAIAKLEAAVGSDDRSLAEPLMGLGRVYLLGNNREKGGSLFERGVSILERTSGENDPEARYQRACFHALVGERTEALRLLRGALDSGLAMLTELMAGNPDLNSLRGDPEFEAIVGEAERQTDAGGGDD